MFIDDLAPLPAAATFIEIDHRLQSTASVIGDTKVPLVEVSLTSPGSIPTISTEVVGGNEDMDSADGDSVGNDTILADEGVLMVNEVEQVLRDAFAEADQLASVTNVQGTVPVGEGLILDWPGPSLGYPGIQHRVTCRGASCSHTTKVRPERHDLRSLRRRWTVSR